MSATRLIAYAVWLAAMAWALAKSGPAKSEKAGRTMCGRPACNCNCRLFVRLF